MPTVPPPRRATLDRAQEIIDALMHRALRFERILEILDLRAARAARKLAERVHVAATLWSEADAASQPAAMAELLEVMDAAEAALNAGDAPAPSTERPAPPTSGVETKDDEDAPSAADHASTWREMLGVPRRRR